MGACLNIPQAPAECKEDLNMTGQDIGRLINVRLSEVNVTYAPGVYFDFDEGLSQDLLIAHAQDIGREWCFTPALDSIECSLVVVCDLERGIDALKVFTSVLVTSDDGKRDGGDLFAGDLTTEEETVLKCIAADILMARISAILNASKRAAQAA